MNELRIVSCSAAILLGAVAGCGGSSDNQGAGGASSSAQHATSTTSTHATSTTTSTQATTTTSTQATTTTPQASSSTGQQAMGDPCRGTPLPTDQSYVAPGLCARLVASDVAGLRQITFASNGDAYGVTAGGSILLFHDANGDGVFDASEIVEVANTGGNGSNCHIDEAGGFLYAGTPTGVSRWAWTPGSTNLGQPDVVVTGQAGDGSHPKHTVHVYDGFLYVHSGSHDNAVDPISPQYDTDRALLRRFPLSTFTPGTPLQWLSGEVYADGIRNMVGYTKNAAGKMFGVVNGLDSVHYQGADVHDDNPGEQILELGLGKHFGYPFCFTAQRLVANGNVIVAGTQVTNADFPSPNDDTWCAANSSKPASFLQAHSAPLDITFFDTAPIGGLPEAWRGSAFIASHGSWDRDQATGYKVVRLPVDANGEPSMPTSDMTTTTFPYETVFGGGDSTGPVDGPWTWTDGTNTDNPRPCGVAISPVDGALYISSDQNGTLYRIGVQH